MRNKLLALTFAGTLGLGALIPLAGSAFAAPNANACHGQVASAEAHEHGGIANAASDDGFTSVKELQQAITAFCS